MSIEQTINAAPVYAILGGTGGIGAALSKRLAAAGARLVIGARNESMLTALAREINATPQVVEATQAEQVDAFIANAIAEHGQLDGVVNCVGSLLLKPAHLTTNDEWDFTLRQNLTSAFYLLRAAAKAMQARGGSIVLVSSAAARTGLANHEAIAAAKAGIIGLTLSAAASYAARGIRVNCVAPGLVATPLTARITGNEVAVKASASMHALGRIGAPDEVASAMAWLLDPANAWVTGQVIGVDGGLASVRPR
jgi:NAD(P)-dependent dehydrogenase (short-subunit alcohol dehydrogenase family)